MHMALTNLLKMGKPYICHILDRTLKQLLQYLYATLKSCCALLIQSLSIAGMNYDLNDKSQSNNENLLSNIKYIVQKCLKFGGSFIPQEYHYR